MIAEIGLLEGASIVVQLAQRLDYLGFRILYGIHASRAATDAMIVFTLSGGVWRDAAVACSLSFARTRRVGGALAAVLTASGIATVVLKYAVRKPRPALVLSEVHALWGHTTTPSFPSGHTASAFAMAAFLVFLSNERGKGPFRFAGHVLLWSWAIGVGISRIFLGVHFPSDALAGAVLGVLTGALGARLYLRHSAPPSKSFVADGDGGAAPGAG